MAIFEVKQSARIDKTTSFTFYARLSFLLEHITGIKDWENVLFATLANTDYIIKCEKH